MGRLVALYNLCVIFSVCAVTVALENTTVGYHAVYEDDNERQASFEDSSAEFQGLIKLTPILRTFTSYCETPNHEPGRCIGIKQCPVLLKQLNNTDARVFLRESRCGPDNEDTLNPKICCGTYGNYKRPRMVIGSSKSNNDPSKKLVYSETATYCETPNHDTGRCIGIKQCRVLLKELNNTEARNFLLQSRCGPDNEDTLNPKVCCGTNGNYVKLRTGIGLNESNTDNLSPAVNILPESCGRQKIAIRGRLYGAKQASLGEYPWMARLIHRNKYGYTSYGCSGFLIHVKYVLTAAHCTHTNQYGNRGPVYSVVLGEHNTETIVDCTPGGTICAEKRQVSRAANVMTHPKYDPESKGHYNDIALIQLKKSAKLSDFVQPICLPIHGSSTPPSYFLSGWGKTENESSSTIKMKLEIIKFDKTECKEKYSFLNIRIKETQICAGGEEQKDACTGDSGGPLMTPSSNGTYYASGIVSFGIGCGMKGWPGIYTNTVKFLPWIKSQMALSMQLTTRSGFKKKGRKGKKGKKKIKAAQNQNGTNVGHL